MSKFKHGIVLTGGIGSGKSTVGRFLRLLGFELIDADSVAHEVLDSISKEIKDNFGDEFVSGDKVDRKRLGAYVFANKSELLRLELLVLPKVRKRIYESSLELEKKNFPYFVDIPLYFEKGGYDFSQSVLVYVPKELQLERVTRRDCLNLDEALLRVEAQMDIEQKKKLATHIINNSGDLASLHQQIDEFIQKLKEKYANLKI